MSRPHHIDRWSDAQLTDELRHPDHYSADTYMAVIAEALARILSRKAAETIAPAAAKDDGYDAYFEATHHL